MPRRIKQAVAKAPADDPQRERLYRMEREAFGGWCAAAVTTLPSAQAWVKRMCKVYAVAPCRVELKDLGVWAGIYDTGVITLSSGKRSGKCLLTLAHEFAHHVHEQFVGQEPDEIHGPAFMCAYIHILDRARMVDAAGMKAICDRYKIKYLDPGNCNAAGTLTRLIGRRRA